MKVIQLLIIYYIYIASFLNPLYENAINFIKRIPILLPDLLLNMQKIAQGAAEKLYKQEHLFCLGKGFGEAIAR